MGFKVENVEVSTYNTEPGTADDYVQLYLKRISDALVKLSSNFTIESPVGRYAAAVNSASCLASTVQLKCTNSESTKYIRMWFFAYCDSSSSTSVTLKYLLVPSNAIEHNNSNLYMNTNNIYIGGHFYSTEKYKIPFIPSGLAIGVSSSPINSNLGQDLNLDIPLFGFNCHNTAYDLSNTSSAPVMTSPFRYIMCDSVMGLTANMSNTLYKPWMFYNVTGGGVNKFTVGTDGSAFYIADKVLLGRSLDHIQNHVCFYAPDMFDNYDENDKRTDGAFCVSQVYSSAATKGVFASYVDTNGSPLSTGSVTEFNLLSGAVNSSQSNDIVYTSAHPVITTNSYSDPLVFNSLSPSKGKFNTDYIRLVDPAVAKRGVTFDKQNWACLYDGVVFPWEPGVLVP